MANLELATSKELIEELFKRYPDAAFVGSREHPKDGEMFQQYRTYQGHFIFLQGLLMNLMRKIQDDEKETGYEQDTEDDL